VEWTQRHVGGAGGAWWPVVISVSRQTICVATGAVDLRHPRESSKNVARQELKTGGTTPKRIRLWHFQKNLTQNTALNCPSPDALQEFRIMTAQLQLGVMTQAGESCSRPLARNN